MAANTQLSVQAIKGKFEQLQDAPFMNVTITSSTPSSSSTSSSSSSSIKRNKNYVPSTEHSFNSDSPLLSLEESIDERSGENRFGDLRFRSYSVGNSGNIRNTGSSGSSGNSSSTVYLRNGNGKNTVEKFSRNQCLGQSRQNEINNLDAEFPNNNFSSFTEKQKLVESIVMNIKNSAVSAKRKEEHRNKDCKSKDILNITSKFEKDLKNVLERGVRKKWNSKSLKEEKHLKDSSFEKDQKLNKAKRHEPLLKGEIGSNQRKSFSKINSILGVDLYPIRSSVSDEIDSRDYAENEATNYPIYKSESSPVMFNKSNNRAKLNRNIDAELTNDSFKENSEPSHSENRYMNNSPQSSLENSPGKLSPVRPPRRRRFKKGKAPQPPSPQWEIERDVVDGNGKDIYEKQDDQNSNEIEDRNLEEENYNVCDDSAFFSLSCESARRLSGELGKEFDYEDRCEKKLEGESFLFDKESIENTYESFNTSNNLENNDSLRPSKWMSMSDSSLGVSTSPLPVGGPPKKPPRTFAYDIYQSLKPEKSEKPKFASTPRLSPQEIESLYTKPLKRLKEKPAPPSSQPPLPNPMKPAIAPKPVDIINKAKQRLSVVEPLPSATPSKEFSDHKTSMKRNSSFRFSFRKQKKGSVSPSRHISPRKESHVGKRLRTVARNLHPKKNEQEKRVHFQPTYDTEVIYNDVEGGPIYATPDTADIHRKEPPKELHYMCSPLFQKEQKEQPTNPTETEIKPEDNTHKGVHRPSSPSNDTPSFGIMNGLKEELRQSCRFVQKRLKGSTLNRDMR